MKNPDYDHLFQSFQNAKSVCPPDEYYKRQRDLLYALTEYILERDGSEEYKAARMKYKEDTQKAFDRLIEDK